MWNYRIIKDKNSYGLYETIYNDQGEITAHAEKAELSAESINDLIKYLEMMLTDAVKHKDDILEIDKIEFAPLLEDDKEDSIEVDFNDFVADINYPPLSWTDPTIETDEGERNE